MDNHDLMNEALAAHRKSFQLLQEWVKQQGEAKPELDMGPGEDSFRIHCVDCGREATMWHHQWCPRRRHAHVLFADGLTRATEAAPESAPEPELKLEAGCEVTMPGWGQTSCIVVCVSGTRVFVKQSVTVDAYDVGQLAVVKAAVPEAGDIVEHCIHGICFLGSRVSNSADEQYWLVNSDGNTEVGQRASFTIICKAKGA